MSNNNNNSTRKRGVDALLTHAAKACSDSSNNNNNNNSSSSSSISFRLIKGPVAKATADPVDAKAPLQAFPLVAKFPESVQKPNFLELPWKHGRLYQQDIPKPAEDSEDDDDDDNNNVNNAKTEQVKKKRWKYNRGNKNNNSHRQWILQEQVDFLETMVAKREHNKEKQHAVKHKLSSRYEGVPEYNASRYALILLNHHDHDHNNHDHHSPTTTTTTTASSLQVQILPSPLSTIPFAQPAARHSLSLSQAEQAIQDQRAGISRTTLLRPPAEQQQQQPGTTSVSAAASLRIPSTIIKNRIDSKHRLLHKLQQKAKAIGDNDDDDIDEADDVMGDVAFRNRKGGAAAAAAAGRSKARQELLALASDGVMVSDEGVLGGTNDAIFGGRGRFGQVNNNNNSYNNNDDATGSDKNATALTSAKEPVAEPQERGADGAAMEDDFYQRDVQAEYEELDYDANEQFDDDDVDLGESEVVVDSGGYGDEDEEDELDEIEGEEEVISGAAGLATAAGFREMLARARGELLPTTTTTEMGAEQQRLAKEALLRQKPDDSDGASDDGGGDHMSKILKAAEEASKAVGKPKPGEAPPSAKPAPPAAASSGIQVDENGLRIINLEAVRKEIWLNHGSIPMKRLMKIFDIKKKSSQERQARFRDVVKELCTMKTDPVGGRMLVLKQHYSNMG